jgi:predicted CoA-binding protein
MEPRSGPSAGAWSEPDDAEVARIVAGARVVAVVGMKDASRGGEPAHSVPKRMQQRGLRVIPVNPTLLSPPSADVRALGERVYARLSDVPDVVDLVQVFRRPENVPAVVADVLGLPLLRRPRVVWLQTGIVHAPSAERLEQEGIRVVMDRCFAVELARLGAPHARA